MQLTWTCSAPDCPGGDWALPTPELEPPDRLSAWQVEGRTVTGEVELHGRPGELAGPAGRLYDDTLARLRGGDLAYQWMPEAMRWTLDAALANRSMDCVSTSLLLEREAAAAGLRTRVRRGLLLGPVTIEHVWAEADQDGPGRRWTRSSPSWTAGSTPAARTAT